MLCPVRDEHQHRFLARAKPAVEPRHAQQAAGGPASERATVGNELHRVEDPLQRRVVQVDRRRGADAVVGSAPPRATQLVGGWIADRFPLRWAYVASWSMQVPLLLTVAYMWELPLVMAMMLVFCTVVISTPVENALLVRYTPGRWRATAFGAKFVLSIGLGSLGLPLVALVHERTGGFFWLFVILSGLALVIAATGLLLPPDRARETTPKAVAVPAE